MQLKNFNSAAQLITPETSATHFPPEDIYILGVKAHVRAVSVGLTLVWCVSRRAMIILGMAHAVAFTCTEHKRTQVGGGMERPKRPRSRSTQSHRVGVAQAPVPSLVHDVETSALVVGAVGRAGDLKQRARGDGMKALVIYRATGRLTSP